MRNIYVVITCVVTLCLFHPPTLFAVQPLTQAELLKQNPTLPELIAIFGGYEEGTEFDSAIFNSSEDYLATLPSNSNQIFVWEIKRSFMVQNIRSEGEVTEIIFHPSKLELFAAHSDGSVVGWNIIDGEEVARFDAGGNSVIGIQFFGNVPFIWVTDATEVSLFDPYTGNQLIVIQTDDVIIDTILDNTSKSLAVLTEEGIIYIYDTQNFDGLPNTNIPVVEVVNRASRVVFSPESTQIVLFLDESNVLVYDIEDEVEPTHQITGFNYSYVSKNNHLHVLPYRDEDQIKLLTIDNCPQNNGAIETSVYFSSVLDVSPDCSIVAFLIEDNTNISRPSAVSLVDTSEGMEFYFFGNTLDSQFSPSGRYLMNITMEDKILLFRTG